jgi:hypothetical protein
MRYLYNFLILENIQQVDKLLRSNGLQRTKVIDDFINFLTKSGYGNYIFFIFSILITYLENSGFDEGDLDATIREVKIERLIDCLEKCKKLKIDVSKLHPPSNIYLFFAYVSSIADKHEIKKFIRNWIPSSLRNQFDYENIDTSIFNVSRIQNLTNSDKELIKKGSRYKSIKEWLDYIILVLNSDEYSLEELLNSNVKVFYQDDEWLLYTPLDFQSYLIPRFKYWCTAQEVQFREYLALEFKILLNKKTKEKSLFIYKKIDNIYCFDYENRELDFSKVGKVERNIITKNL